MKEELYQSLKDMLYARNDVYAAHLGGSSATGFEDEFSDLDLEVICADHAVEDIFKDVETFLQKNYGILQSYRMPEPTWHGFSQCFYLVDKMPKHFYIDLAIVKNTLKDRLTDSKRHGHAVVWFDKGQYIIEKDDSDEETIKRAKQFYQRAISIDFLMMIEVEKNLDRNRYIDGFLAYYRFIQNQLVVMLNLKHRPYKVDFGMRYAYRDYDDKDYRFLQNCLQQKSLEDLKKNYKLAKSYYLVLKKEFQETYQNKEV